MTHQKKQLLEALFIFKTHFSGYIVSLLDPENIGNWEPIFRETLYNERNNNIQENWIRSITGKEISEFVNCIDFIHFEIFAEKRKDLFNSDFILNISYLPTWLNGINYVRNNMAHYIMLLPDDINLALKNIIRIAEIMNDIELQNRLKAIKDKLSNQNNEPQDSHKLDNQTDNGVCIENVVPKELIENSKRKIDKKNDIIFLSFFHF